MNRPFLLICFFLSVSTNLLAQNKSDIESTIRALEQQGVNGILHADTTLLQEIWDKDFIVMTPRNTIAGSRSAVFKNQRTGLIDYSSFERAIDKILIKGDIVITMGTETFVAKHDLQEAKAGQPMKRKFTNVWTNQSGKWQQIARHASIICAP